MSKRFILPCPTCQHPILVEPAQAGREIPCPACQATVVIPTLRKMQTLEAAGTAVQTKSKSGEWLPDDRQSFSIALGVFFIGLILAGVFQLMRIQMDTQIPENPNRAAMFSEIDQASADDLFGLWKGMIRQQELEEQPPNEIVTNIKKSRGYLRLVIVGSVIAIGGLGASLWFGYKGWTGARRTGAAKV